MGTHPGVPGRKARVAPLEPSPRRLVDRQVQTRQAGPPPDTRVNTASARGWLESWNNYATDHTWRVLDELSAVAEQVGKTPAQVALRWLLDHPDVTAPIIGARTLTQLEDNLGATGWGLSTEQRTALTTASAPPQLPYPYNILATSARR